MASSKPFCLQIIWKAIREPGIDKDVADICMAGFANSTLTQYEGHLKALQGFCKTKGKIYTLSL